MATIERVGEALAGQALEINDVRVVEIDAELGADAEGNDALIIRVVLANPPAGAETWPIEAVWELRQLIRERIALADPDPAIPWIISIEPEHGGEVDPEDAQGEIAL